MAEEKTVSSRRIYEGRAFNVRVDTVITVDGRESTRDIVEHSACVAIIAREAGGDILLVRQYRKAVEKELLEIPAGGIDPGEDPESAVRREMQEETGFLPGRVVRLGGYYSSPGFSTEYLYLFLAADLTPSRLYAEDTPGIEVVRVKPRDIRRLVRSQQICDSKSVAGLLYYLDYRKRNPA